MDPVKVAYYRDPSVVQRYFDQRFGGKTGTWVHEQECDGVAQALGTIEGLVLDVAAGQGRLSRWLADKGYQVVGLDTSLEMLKLGNHHRIAGSAFQMPFAAEAFGGIVGLRFLFHLSDLEPLLKEITRVLKPGGRCVLDSANWTIRSLFPMLGSPNGGDIYSHSPRKIRELAARQGLEWNDTVSLFSLPPSLLRFLPLTVALVAERACSRGGLRPSRFLISLEKRKNA